ncbi:MAG: HEAT repeat domain-containing protein, partial [Planctomycetota bacterium]
REVALIDEALSLLNMTRRDAEFDKLVIDDDWRLDVVNRTLSKPLEAADVAWEWSERAKGKPEEILASAARELGYPEPKWKEFALPPLDLARMFLGQATGDLSEAERERLLRWAYAESIHEESHDGLLPKLEGEPDPEAMLALAKRVDRGKLVQAAIEILRSLPEYIEDVDTKRRGVVVAGPEDDVHDLTMSPPAILIDIGGNDRYISPASATPDHPIAVVLDLGGDDIYGGGSLTAGAGLLGVGILWDKGEGDDRYISGHLSQGCGLFGVGLLVDEGGADQYSMKDTGQGAGAFGIGLLLDLGEGNDLLHADFHGQGFASVGGFGLLRNEKGNEVYDAGGVHLHYPLFNDRFQSLSQGFSIGMRPYASGGVGLLLDDQGNDRYACDIYGQGASYWFAYGGLVDRDGNDTYNLGQYGQGGGIHLAVGCLIDLAGQDLYYNMHGVGTGGAHDFAVGLLVDRAGDDYYAGSGGTMGGALTNSFALLLDGGGNDGYSAVKVRHAVGGGRPARGMGSIGLLLDLDGKDLHGTRAMNGLSWSKESYGAGIDLPEAPKPEKAPPRRPHLSPEEVEARIRKGAWDDQAGAFDLEKLWAIAREWPVGEMADIVPRALEHLHAMGDPAFQKALSLVGTKRNLEDLAVSKLLKLFGQRSVPPLIEMLEAGDDRRRSHAARFLADLGAKRAAPSLVPLLGHEKTKRSALDALSRLEAKEHWSAVLPLLADEVELTRVTAVRCLQKLGAKTATSALVMKLRSDEMFTVRFAAEDVLVSFGEDSVPPLLHLAKTGDDLIARRHAIRALGRIASPGTLGFLVRISDEPDWRIRHDVAGALASFLEKEGPAAAVALEVLGDRARREEHRHVRARLGRLLD